LRKGPLRRIARQAEENPDSTFVLVIDEVNRGNVAKVFGELYYLLEYRDDALSLLYSDEKAALPPNLWIIGTMNTADRSIALVDAALRRRFHFVPFFPDQPPVEGLLRRWLKVNKPPLEWVADVVDRANGLFGNSHMAIGPSHFIRADLDEEWVELIWEHSILPHVAEQFFGDEPKLAGFALDKLRPKLSSQPE
jgi:MoxR-like ATPase